jgi:hypothetical protein
MHWLFLNGDIFFEILNMYFEFWFSHFFGDFTELTVGYQIRIVCHFVQDLILKLREQQCNMKKRYFYEKFGIFASISYVTIHRIFNKMILTLLGCINLMDLKSNI